MTAILNRKDEKTRSFQQEKNGFYVLLQGTLLDFGVATGVLRGSSGNFAENHHIVGSAI